MQQSQEQGKTPPAEQNSTAENQMAQNPNPRANENIRNTPFEKSEPQDGSPDVGSEITDGTGG